MIRTIAGCLLFLTIGVLAAQDDTTRHEAERALIREKSLQAFDQLPLEYDAAGKAAFHVIDPEKRFFLADGYRYFGFRFRTPPKIEGDFGWTFILKPRDGPVMIGYSIFSILRRNGPMKGFETYEREKVADYPELIPQFPFTQNVTLQSLAADHFLPDEEYVIWFRYAETEATPPMAVAFAFAPPGKNWKSRLPLGRKFHAPSADTPASIEGDPW